MRAVYASIKQAILSRGFLLAFAGTALVVLLAPFEGFSALPFGAAAGIWDITIPCSSPPFRPRGMALALPIPLRPALYRRLFSGRCEKRLHQSIPAPHHGDGYITSRALDAPYGGLAISLGILAAYGIAALLLLCPWRPCGITCWNPPGTFASFWKRSSCSSPPGPSGRWWASPSPPSPTAGIWPTPPPSSSFTCW